MNDYTQAFSRLREWQKIRGQERDKYFEEMNARLAAECESAYRRRFPRRAFSMVDSRDKNPDEHKAIYGRLKPEVDRYLADWDDEERQIRWALTMLAVKADVPQSETWRSVYSVSDSTYRSQGWGAAKYARVDAEAKLNDFLLHVAEGRVENQFHPFERPVHCASGERALGWHEYHVMVPTTELGACILTHKPEQPLREYVRRCWKRGVNPRVYLPFLPYDYEEAVGIDYFGNDLQSRVAISKPEPSRQPAVAA